jgi:hypothetical protein
MKKSNPRRMDMPDLSEQDHAVIRVRCLVACFDKEVLPDEMIEVALDNLGSVDAVVNYLLTVLDARPQ